jgi:hypothetical protein
MLFAFLIFMQFKFNAQNYPDAAALIIKDVIEINIDKDFKKEQHRDYKVYIFNVRGREHYSDMFEKYNKKKEKLELVNVQTVLSDGRVLKPEDKAISDLGTVEGLLAPAYRDLRTRTVSYSGVEPDATLEYESKKSSKEKPEDNYISGIKVFQKQDPILSREFRLSVPKNTTLKYTVIGGKIKTEEKEAGDFHVYRWWVDSMPRIKREPYKIPLNEFAPRLAFTNFKDWDEVGEWLWKKFEESIDLSKEIKKRVATLAGKSKDVVMSDLYTEIAKNWRNIPLTLSDVGYTPNKTGDVYKNRYGNQIDQVALIVALLKAAGYEAFPAYISYSPVEDKLPMPNYFEHVLVAVPEGDGFIYLDTRFPDRAGSFYGFGGILGKYNKGFPLLPDVLGRYAFIVKPDARLFTSLPNYDAPIAVLNMDIVINDDGSISGSLDAELDGLSATLARMGLRHKKEKEEKIAVEKMLGSLKTGTTLKDFQVSGLDEPLAPVKIKLEFHSPDYLIKQGKNLKFDIPIPLFSFFSIAAYFGTESREYPLAVGNARRLSCTINAHVPGNFNIVYMPEKISIDNNTGSTSARYELTDDNILKIEKHFSFRKSDYEAAEYDDLQSVYNAYASMNQRLVIFSIK